MKHEHNGTLLLRCETIFFAAVLLTTSLLIAYFFPETPDGSAAATDIIAAETPLQSDSLNNSTIVEEYSVSLKSAASSYTKKKDTALTLYRSNASRPAVEWFYAHITENSGIARAILEHADKNDIPLSLAFALAYTESRYNISAVNRNTNGTIDRGLFQLNSASFPRIAENDFFDAETSAQYGLSHLRFCLVTAGNEVAALAMYNAGANRIKNDGAPRLTLNYISNIMSYRQALDELFRKEVASFFDVTEKPLLAYAQ
jgi:soluble lytic murein transglycosylase-like protein